VSDFTRIREAGDSALLLELAGGIDPEVNARAVAIAEAVRNAGIAGVRGVISTYRSVAVYFDPLVADAALVTDVLRGAQRAAPVQRVERVVDIPVAYGGDNGPDLEDVAARARMSVQEVIERHAARTYRVYMMGFLPGFAYLGTLDPALATPRRPTPRLRVPRGSVAIAGQQTGVYPTESPGGWQLIGRTSTDVFDPARTPAALLAPGDHVRFVPVSSDPRPAPVAAARTTASAPDAGAPRDHARRQITVVKPGMFTTIQDLGRWTHQSSGVPVAGPMDAMSYRLANLIVGNAWGAAALEATVVGPELRIDADCLVAITGADLGATLDARLLPLNTAVACAQGSVIRCGERRRGARAYIAFDGGIGTPAVLGSRATHVRSAMGGVTGGALRAGDVIPLQPPAAMRPTTAIRAGGTVAAGGARLRILLGPQDDFFPPAAVQTLQRTRFTITSQSDRMGYRLAGREQLPYATTQEMISDATFAGAIQVPRSGEPILLMADRQTTGGYPQIATVITADLPLAGQLAPGDWVEFQLCTRAEALAALVAQEAALLANE
jgi:KipI family sensor histidine kinase inhibitor